MSNRSVSDQAKDDIGRFNALGEDEARDLLESCLAVSRWVDEMMAGRPYDRSQALLARAEMIVQTLTPEEVERALARHPRIGERAGEGHDVEFSTWEQSGVDGSDTSVAVELREGNADYERRFDRVFLIRAAGRTSTEVLAELRRRLRNSDEAEAAEVASELGDIALGRLQRVIAS